MKKPRFIAGILFGVLTFVHYFSMLYLFVSMPITNMPLFFFPEIIVLGVYFWACYKNVGSEQSLSKSQKKQVIAASIMYLVFNAANIATTLEITAGSLGVIAPALAQSRVASIAALVIKLVLFVAAVCFCISEPKKVETAANEIEQELEKIDETLDKINADIDKTIDSVNQSIN